MKRRMAFLLVLAALVAGACNVNVDKGSDLGGGADIPNGCAGVDMAVSPEKFDLLTQLAEDFNKSDEAKKAKPCAFVRVNKTSSGVGATLLADGWQDPARDGPRPGVWAPGAKRRGPHPHPAPGGEGQPADGAGGRQAVHGH